MRLATIRHLLISVTTCVLLNALGAAAQQDQVTTTVIDILSSNPEFSLFLRVLQRNQLIPYINQLENITLIAPINSAFAESTSNTLETFSLDDLNRYIVSQPLSSNHTPGLYIYQSKAYENDRDTDHSSTYTSPISFEVHENKKLRLNNVTVVEKDLYAETQNSYVQGTVATFNHILSLEESLKRIPHSGKFHKLVESSSSSSSLTNKTVLLFTNSASPFNDHQIKYLSDGKYGKEDSKYIFNSLLLPGYIGGVGEFTVKDMNGFEVQISSSSSLISVNSTIRASVSNIIATDGIIHVFDTHEIVQSIEFNVLKTLVGLGCAAFVDELLFQDLGYLLTDNSLKQTIFHTKDSDESSDVAAAAQDEVELLSRGENLYHFVKDMNHEDFHDLNTTLVTTRYCSSKKLGSKDHCQRLKVGRLDEDSFVINNNIIVQSQPVTVGATSIYIIDEDLRVPHDLVSAVNPLFDCSRSLEYLHRLNLHRLPNHENGYTYFLPCFKSLENWELTLKYLESTTGSLMAAMKGIVMEDLLYSDYSEGDDFNSTNLLGDTVMLSDFELNETNLEFAYNDIHVSLNRLDDVIFDQGVAHPVDTFLIPDNLKIQNTDILTAFDTVLFQKYLSFFPRLSAMVNDHSLLVPSGLSLSKFQFEKNTTLEQLLHVHILPRESTLKILNCGVETQDIRTLNPKVNLTCSSPANHDTFITVKGDNDIGNRVRILKKGCVSNDHDICIFEIDKPIEADSGHFHVSLPGTAFAIGILLGSLSMVFILLCLMMVVARTKGVFTANSDTENNNATGTAVVDANTVLTGSTVDERTSLLVHSENGFEHGYSGMSNTDPISMQRPAKVDFAV
ncbi:hypothetical protein WICPIJ_008086 [Wickerhamomyces pijperi]|uniref:FAS1 domain-containing protein n=1 Tax=Wickerhamomyces pijperi TaxID=599730 RepID=A0A9P8PYU9_WICPI|nr:hypothetical protein WICPIJ_008086 [Wickerhamomyces pijperi]